MELKQHLKLSQQLVMTPQLQQAIKLLQLSRMELVDLIRTEVEQNPLLEEPTDTTTSEGQEVSIEQAPAMRDAMETEVAPPASDKMESLKPETTEVKREDIDWEQYIDNYQTQHTAPSGGGSSGSEDLPSFEANLTRSEGLAEHLMLQLRMGEFTDEEQQLGALIIGNLDDDGYLKLDSGEDGDPLIPLALEAGVHAACADRVLKKLQLFDPIGCGSRDLRECLLIQAHLFLKNEGKDDPDAELVPEIIRSQLKHVESKNYNAIARALKVPLSEVVEAVKIIAEFEPKPGRAYSGEEAQYITPDVYVYKIGDAYSVVLNDDGLSKLRISQNYRSALKNGTANGAKDYIQEKLRSAVWLIRSIHQRQRTIYKVTESIVKFQRDFLDKGIAHLRPLILRDVAEDIGMHESTVSRVTTNKYVHTPQGIYELKFFFNSKIGRIGAEDIASEAVKNHIKLIVAAEDPSRPYSDQKLVEVLRQQNIDIARRTVAKYREVLGILPSSKRRRYF